MAEIVLNVEVRERTGTGGARDTRRSGMVPGVLYGGDKDPVAIAVKSNEFRKALYTGKLLGHLVTLKYGDESQPVIAKAVDMHPVTDEPWHFDLYRVNAHQQIKIEVPVHFAHQEESPGLKRGGTLGVTLHTVTVACHADSIPEEIVVDLTGLDIGSTIRVSDLTVPQGATAALAADAVVASIAGAMAEEVEVVEEPAEGVEGAEGEEAAAEGGEAAAEAKEGGGEE
jgi:large subunit ribosomal protein L25